MDTMTWTIIVAACLILGLSIVFWQRGIRGRKLARLFQRHVRIHNGTVKAGNPLAYPQLTFRRNGLDYRVTAMGSAGVGALDRGPFSTVTVTLHGDTGRRIRLTRRSGVISAVVDQVADAAAVNDTAGANTECSDASIGDAARHEHGRGDDVDDRFLHDLLSYDVKASLVNAPLDNLEIDIDRGEIRAHCSGILSTPAELQALIGCAGVVADRFLPE